MTPSTDPTLAQLQSVSIPQVAAMPSERVRSLPVQQGQQAPEGIVDGVRRVVRAVFQEQPVVGRFPVVHFVKNRQRILHGFRQAAIARDFGQPSVDDFSHVLADERPGNHRRPEHGAVDAILDMRKAHILIGQRGRKFRFPRGDKTI